MDTAAQPTKKASQQYFLGLELHPLAGAQGYCRVRVNSPTFERKGHHKKSHITQTCWKIAAARHPVPVVLAPIHWTATQTCLLAALRKRLLSRKQWTTYTMYTWICTSENEAGKCLLVRVQTCFHAICWVQLLSNQQQAVDFVRFIVHFRNLVPARPYCKSRLYTSWNRLIQLHKKIANWKNAVKQAG